MAYGLYIHVPFCRNKCPYCDFYSCRFDETLALRYITVLARQLNRSFPEISSVYIGGGTPSVLTVSHLARLLDSLMPILTQSQESTVEINPESVTREKLILLKERGISRISVGVQSFLPEKLRILGRIHSVRDSYVTIELAHSLGFENISIDLLYGVPYEKCAQWEAELSAIKGLPVTHVSCYSLTLETEMPFFPLSSLINTEEVAEMYSVMQEYLEGLDYYQYEVSNFSQPGFRCEHNLKYWRGAPYLGYGPGAFSYHKGIRSQMVRDLSQYLKRFEQNQSLIDFSECLTPIQRAKERAAFMIRMVEGIDCEYFKTTTEFSLTEIIEWQEIVSLQEKGLLCVDRGKAGFKKIALTKKGFLFCDEVSAAFL